MTSEEISQEAEEHCNEVMCTVCENKTCTERKIKCREWRDRRAGYYCGAEPREKRITELEQTNNNLLDVINNQDVKIADLEKENAELKRRLDNLFNSDCWASEKLTKAKELLQRFIETSNPIYFEEDRQKVKTQAEQFLKEIEK